MDLPANLLYTKDHEWARVEDGTLTIGITEYAVDELGDIVFVELPEPGDEIDQNEVFGTIESVKAVAELFAPVSGEVLEFNDGLEDAPESVNDDPYGAWMIKVKVADEGELDLLLSPEQYSEYLEQIS